MRLWSLHPRYLDRQGLLAVWREGLLAQNVLAEKTKGYKHHPQLIRFRETKDPLAAIGLYLDGVAIEAFNRGYHFDRTKILRRSRKTGFIPVSRGQMKFERTHLLRKLKIRDAKRHVIFSRRKRPAHHPIFRVVAGEIHSWEKL